VKKKWYIDVKKELHVEKLRGEGEGDSISFKTSGG